MNSLVVILCEFPTLLGGERSMFACMDHVAAAGFQPLILGPRCGPLAEAAAAHGVEVLDFQVRDAAGVRRDLSPLRSELQSQLRAVRPALIHANSLAMGRLCGPVTFENGMASVSHLRDILRLSGAVVADLNRHDRLLAVSQATADFHVAQGLDRQKTFVCHNGVDVALFRPRPPTGYLARELAIDRSSRFVATIGQIGPRKGMDRFLAVAERVAPSYPHLHWLVVGTRTSGKQEAREFEDQLADRSARMGLRGRVHLLGTRHDVERILNEVAVLVHAARQEPLGRVLLEAAASGVPVVATDVGGTREIFPTAEDGAILVRGDQADSAVIAAIALALESLLSDENRGAILARGGRRRIKKTFSATMAANRLLGHYQAVQE